MPHSPSQQAVMRPTHDGMQHTRAIPSWQHRLPNPNPHRGLQGHCSFHGTLVALCTCPFPAGKDFYSFLVRTLTKSYPAIFPARLPRCPTAWTLDHVGSGCEIVPGYRYKDLTGLLRVMGFHWRYATRKLSSSALLVFHFSPFLRMGRLSPHAAHKIIQAASVIHLVIESFLRFTKT